MKLTNIILPDRDPASRWDVEIQNQKIRSITTHSKSNTDPPSLLLPSLCHPHIHLDKAYLLTSESNRTTHDKSCFHTPSASASKESYPNYKPFTPQSGSFSEALSLTSLSKAHYTAPDLRLRGAQLLATSLTQGVTSCRAFVEVDHVTQLTTLEAGLALKALFEGHDDSNHGRGLMRVQICAFAQDPIFSSEHGAANRAVLEDALAKHSFSGIEVLGTTPYVEQTRWASLANIEWAITTALKHDLHLDFHLDYNLDPDQDAMVWDVVRLLKAHDWAAANPNSRKTKRKKVVLGHCTRLTLFSPSKLAELATQIRDAGLQDSITFVGLPSSDIFMMGRATETAHRPRGTLHLPTLHANGLNTALGVNNVGNAFTPWGTGDPLALASLCVGIYQSGTPDDAALLYTCISEAARHGIGLSDANPGDNAHADEEPRHQMGIREGQDVTLQDALLLITNAEFAMCPGQLGIRIPARQRWRVRDVVWDPPEIGLRKIIR